MFSSPGNSCRAEDKSVCNTNVPWLAKENRAEHRVLPAHVDHTGKFTLRQDGGQEM